MEFALFMRWSGSAVQWKMVGGHWLPGTICELLIWFFCCKHTTSHATIHVLNIRHSKRVFMVLGRWKNNIHLFIEWKRLRRAKICDEKNRCHLRLSMQLDTSYPTTYTVSQLILITFYCVFFVLEFIFTRAYTPALRCSAVRHISENISENFHFFLSLFHFTPAPAASTMHYSPQN